MEALKWENKILISDHVHEIPEASHRQLCLLAKEALLDAYAVYSSYKVGAAVLMSDGSFIKGSNQENAVYPLGLCAERVAIFAACAQYPKEKIVALAVATEKKSGHGNIPAFPCGSCRQVMVELESRYQLQIPIYILNSESKVYIIDSVKTILPFAFGQNFIK